MSAPLACPRCGFQNRPGDQYCTNCGAPLGPVPGAAGAPQAAPMPAAYGYAAPAASYDWTRQVDRTKTGVFLLLLGSLLSWAPYGISIIGDLFLFIGAVMVILGRKAFGPSHSRNVVVSIILFVVGILIVIVVAVIALLPSVPSIISNNGTLTPAVSAAAQNAGLAGAIASAIVIGIAEVLFTYALQVRTGRILLWVGYAANLVVNIVIYAVLSPVYNAVVTQAQLNDALGQQTTYTLLAVFPALVFAAADYLAWSRISRREIPAVPAAPSAPWTPPPSGPAPPMNPR